jgi:16S rRNA (guanine966-N2)-methyltransferase
MRVVAGELRGRLLLAPRGQKVRPTSDRVREAIFSALGPVEGMRVLDVYCGTGALAIEALSRGAESAVLIDRDIRPALGNVHSLGLENRAELVRGQLPERLEAPGIEGPFDLILCDPPYRLADRIGGALERSFIALLAPGGRVVLESPARRPIEMPSMHLLRERRYGGTHVAFYESQE